MVEGDSGLLSVLPSTALRKGSVEEGWNRGNLELFLANGCYLKGYSSEEPGRLRGPQHHRVWVDEPASFKDANLSPFPENPKEDRTWANLFIRCRLGDNPQVVVTGTPKNVALVRYLLETAVVTRATTYDNLANLSPNYRRIIEAYEGTSIGRQELLAELLEEVSGALFKREWIDDARVQDAPNVGYRGLGRIVVAVDPSGSSRGAECGIVIVGTSFGEGYVIGDYSGHFSPAEWGQRARDAYHDHEADFIVGERNFGGDMVKTIIGAQEPGIPYRDVHAGRGQRKEVRADPVANLYERGMVHHVGLFSKLEDQLCTWVPGEKNQPSPDRLDALVWAVTALGIGHGGGARTQAASHRGKPGATNDLLRVAL